jgi:hypothetical protein
MKLPRTPSGMMKLPSGEPDRLLARLLRPPHRTSIELRPDLYIADLKLVARLAGFRNPTQERFKPVGRSAKVDHANPLKSKP